MAEKQVKVVRKGGFVSFVLGFVLGIIFVFGSVVGLAAYAYKNLSIKNIEDSTGINLPVNDEVKNQSIEKLINLTTELVSDQDNLTLKKIEETFGVYNSLTGNAIPVAVKKSADGNELVYIYNTAEINEDCLDISEFHTIPVSQLSSKLTTFINNISLADLQKVANFTLPDIPLINNVKKLPLLTALNEISDSLDLANLTLADLKTAFDIDLSTVTALQDFMNIPLNGESENLATALQNSTIANFTGLSQKANESNQAYAYRLQQAGVLGAIAGYKTTELQTQLDNITLGKLLGYEKQYIRSGTEGNYAYTLESDAEYNKRIKDAGLLGALKDANLTNLQEKIEELDLENKTIGELEELKLVDLSGYSEQEQTKLEQLRNATLNDIINAYLAMN